MKTPQPLCQLSTISFIFCAFLILPHASAQTDRFVATSGSNGGNNCASAASPCATIGHALGQSTAGDRIRVAAGIYTESVTVDRSIEVVGDGMEDTIIQAAATPDTASNRVFTVSSSDDTLTLRDLTVRHGFASGVSGVNSRGGAVYLSGSALEAEHVAFVANRANGRGGAIENAGGSVLLNFADLRDNIAGAVDGNFQRGGAIHNDGGGSITAINSFFRGNTGAEGGAIYSFGSDSLLSLTNVAVTGNLATSFGGGIANGAGPLMITNSTFSGNHSSADTGAGGGAIRTGGSNPHPLIRNSVFHNNRDRTGTGTTTASISSSASSNPRFSHSLVQGCGGSGSGWNTDCGTDLGGNLPNQNPQFSEVIPPTSAPNAGGNVRQRTGSPMIDRGNNSYIAGVSLDLDGLERIIDNIVDLGPYEFGNDGLFSDRFEN